MRHACAWSTAAGVAMVSLGVGALRAYVQAVIYNGREIMKPRELQTENGALSSFGLNIIVANGNVISFRSLG